MASAIAPLPVPTSRTRGSPSPRDPRQAALDHDLRLGPRHEDAPVDGEREPPEAPLAEDVRQRLAPLSPGNQPLERLRLRGRQLPGRLERELRP